jgi:hypothetical protein
MSIYVSENPACPGDFVNVSVTNNDNGEYSLDGLVVNGCNISWSDGQTYALGYLYMPGQENVEIVAHNDNYFSTTSLTVINGANIPGQTTNRPVAGSIISNGTLSPTNFILCAVGSGITAPTNCGTVVNGMLIPTVYSLCGNTIASTTNFESYTRGDIYFTWTSNGVLVTNIPSAFTSAGSYSFEGYVTYIPPAGFLFTNAITVDLGPLTVCVFSFSNSCTPGSVSLANNSAATNFILGAAPSLSVSTNATDAALEFITNCDCDTSLNANVRSNLPPIILSKWWTVSGPGTNYTNHGTGLSTGSLSPIPTNGGTGTATFYISYTTWTNSANSAPWCCTNTNSVQVPFNVLALNITDVSTDPNYNRISTTNTNNVVISGQSIQLVAQTLGGTFSNFQWLVDATVYTNFYVSTDGLWTNGYPTPLTSTNSTNLAFFWVDAGAKRVTCSALCAGTSCTQNICFTVVRPTISISNSIGSVNIGTEHWGDLRMQFGLDSFQTNTVGITFIPSPLSFTNPLVMFPQTNLTWTRRWVQIITSNFETITISQTIPLANLVYTNQTVGTVLDTQFPYPIFLPTYNNGTCDSPDIGLYLNKQVAAYDTQTSIMYFLFQPTNGFPVPMWSTCWDCSGMAIGFGTNALNWSLTGTNISVLSNGDSGSTYPVWTNNATNFQFQIP